MMCINVLICYCVFLKKRFPVWCEENTYGYLYIHVYECVVGKYNENHTHRHNYTHIHKLTSQSENICNFVAVVSFSRCMYLVVCHVNFKKACCSSPMQNCALACLGFIFI